MRDIAIVGGGASGIAAAIRAADSGARVTLYEAAPRIGRSILASGNGRCNWSNRNISARDYSNAPFVDAAFASCPPAQVWDWFDGLGLVSADEPDGRRYPLANKASSVLDVLRFALDERGVQVRCGSPAVAVRPAQRGWELALREGDPRRFDAVVLAGGGGMSEGLLPQGCRIAARRSRLCPIRTDRALVGGLDNVRAKAQVTLRSATGAQRAAEYGEVQFRSYGVSGIVVFNLSRFARPGDVLSIDFVPNQSEAGLSAGIERRRRRFPQRSAADLLAGMLLPSVARAALRAAGVDPAQPAGCVDARRAAAAVKRFELPAEGFEEKNAQVRQGGVRVDQVDSATMALRGNPGLFVTGEALDVDGPCGGYNLHWAWTSGLLAGASAADGA